MRAPCWRIRGEKHWDPRWMPFLIRGKAVCGSEHGLVWPFDPTCREVPPAVLRAGASSGGELPFGQGWGERSGMVGSDGTAASVFLGACRGAWLFPRQISSSTPSCWKLLADKLLRGAPGSHIPGFWGDALVSLPM